MARIGRPRRADPQWREDERGCWVWRHSLNNGGYGTAWEGGRRYCAHRWMYLRACGPIPDGYDIDHLCRNRACVNPDHLEAVPHFENLRRGRGAKLTDAQVAQIRTRVESNVALGREYGVDPTTISVIRSGRARNPDGQQLPASHRRQKLSDDDVREIVRRVQAGETQRGVADAFGVGNDYVSRLANGKKRRALTAA